MVSDTLDFQKEAERATPVQKTGEVDASLCPRGAPKLTQTKT